MVSKHQLLNLSFMSLLHIEKIFVHQLRMINPWLFHFLNSGFALWNIFSYSFIALLNGYILFNFKFFFFDFDSVFKLILKFVQVFFKCLDMFIFFHSWLFKLSDSRANELYFFLRSWSLYFRTQTIQQFITEFALMLLSLLCNFT